MNRDLVVIGLGNPGSRYAHTRHNVGLDALEQLVARCGERLGTDKRIGAMTADLRLGSSRVLAAFPTSFMNESGGAVAALARRHEIDDWSRLLIMHDELDLDPGRVKLKLGGGLAGHNGLRSITQHLHTQDFSRVRIGVGRPPGGAEHGADWVLSRVPRSQRAELDVACEVAADAVERIAADGIDAAMQEFNQA